MRAVPALAALMALLALTTCGRNDQSGPGGVTARESQALDDAAETIEKQRLPEDAVRAPAPSPPPAPSAAAK
jgi:hypothetical protein